jgi:hypothetical protein
MGKFMTYAAEIISDGMHDTYMPSFMTIGSGIQIIIGILRQQFGTNDGFLRHAAEMASGGMIYIPHFTKTGTGVQAILRFYFRNLKGCMNAGITGGRDL